MSGDRAGGRLARVFAELRRRGDGGLIAYLVGGDPEAETSLRALKACTAGGADVLEVGMPFSDPMSEGVAIQRGHERALAAGMTLDLVLRLVQDFRQQDADTPVVLMGYCNPVLAFGARAFVARAAEVGVDGLLLVDLPLEEAGEISALAAEHGLDLVLLASPSTPPERMARLAEATRGYLYYVSYKGVTGTSSPDLEQVRDRLATLPPGLEVPLAVGFGVRDAEGAAGLAELADAVVVGSALVEYCARHPVNLENLQQKVASLKAALRGRCR